MTLRKLMEDTRESLLQEKLKLEKKLSEAPEGTLIYSKCSTNHRVYYKWFASIPDKNGFKKKHYISKENRSLARALARKRLQSKRLRNVEAQLSAVDSFLKKYRGNSDLDYLLDTPLIENLLTEDYENPSGELSEELEKWAHEEYETNPFHPEHKTIMAVDNIMVRSKSEAMIAMLLSAFHIPFRYECKLEVGGHIFYPDFTIRHPLNGKTYYWEHVGMLDHPGYRTEFLNKLRIYINNGILPDHNLILTFETNEQPLDVSMIRDKIREFFTKEDLRLY